MYAESPRCRFHIMRKAQATGDGIRDRDKVRIRRLRSRRNARNLKNEWSCGGEEGRKVLCREIRPRLVSIHIMRNVDLYGRSGETGCAQKGVRTDVDERVRHLDHWYWTLASA